MSIIEITKKTSVEYPSRICVTEVTVFSSDGEVECFHIDDILFAKKNNILGAGKARKKAVSEFIKRIKKEAKTINDCLKIAFDMGFFSETWKEYNISKESILVQDSESGGNGE